MYKLLCATVVLFFLNACGGSDDSDDQSSLARVISGTAATGIAIDGVVNVYGSNGGSTLNVSVDVSGNYSVDVTGMEGPFFISAIPNDANLVSQYSWANGPGTTNITPMTTLTLFYANGEQDPAMLVNSWPGNSVNVTDSLSNAQALVNANFVGAFAGVNIDFTIYDFFSAVFSIGDVFDNVLDTLIIDVTGATPVITVDGSTYIFDINIDTTGINIGGSGEVNVDADFGGLTLSGPDTNVIGTSFIPNVAGNLFTESGGGVSWNTTADLQAVEDGYFNIDIVAQSLEDVTFTFYTGTSESIFEAYHYRLRCLTVATECGKVILDVGSRTVTFNSVSLFVQSTNENISTAAIEISGVLNW